MRYRSKRISNTAYIPWTETPQGNTLKSTEVCGAIKIIKPQFIADPFGKILVFYSYLVILDMLWNGLEKKGDWLSTLRRKNIKRLEIQGCRILPRSVCEASSHARDLSIGGIWTELSDCNNGDNFMSWMVAHSRRLIDRASLADMPDQNNTHV